jgi:N-acetylmuramoyl-L-alanine amidase
VANWSVFDRGNGKNGYGRIQNGKEIIQPSCIDFPTVSLVNGKLIEGEFPEANPGFSRWRVLVRNGVAVVDFVADGNQRVKDARSAVGQLQNGNIVLITVEGDDTKKIGMTGVELGQFAVSLGCTFCCDCDGGGSAACRTKGGYIYNQGRPIAGAMVVRKKIIKEEAKTMGKKKIFIDVGHGGTDPGAQANGLIEKNLNLTVGLKLKELLLAKGFDVMLSRGTDSILTLTERCNMANKWGADCFIAVHHNAGGGDGWETIHTIHTKQSEGDEIADAIGKEFTKAGQNMRRMFSRESTKYPGTDYYTVINKTNMPAVITEFAFLDTEDYKEVDTVEELYKEAQAIANGLCNYYGVGVVAPVDDSWKIAGIEALAKAGIITDRDFWVASKDTKIDVWAACTMMAKLLELIKI